MFGRRNPSVQTTHTRSRCFTTLLAPGRQQTSALVIRHRSRCSTDLLAPRWKPERFNPYTCTLRVPSVLTYIMSPPSPLLFSRARTTLTPLALRQLSPLDAVHPNLESSINGFPRVITWRSQYQSHKRNRYQANTVTSRDQPGHNKMVIMTSRM